YLPHRALHSFPTRRSSDLALCMMGNTVIRAEGKPKFAMIAMIIPSVGNLILDYLFINVLDYGMLGAGWATTASYVFCLGYILWRSEEHTSELQSRENLVCR